MPRAARSRIVVPGLPHHLVLRGNNKRRLFSYDRDRILFLRLLAEAMERYDVPLYALVLMANHVHLVTGVPTVDTIVAQHLLKTVAAARLMGADCIISGIRPQIAQTIIHLGVDLTNVATKATLADAFALALRRTGASVVRSTGTTGPAEVA